ncbi:MAG: hypothetical protein ABIH57_01155 [Candidatus Omnitrophota bacterium]
MKKIIPIILLIVFVSILMSGCGETLSGIGKDAKRITKGVKTVFVRED